MAVFVQVVIEEVSGQGCVALDAVYHAWEAHVERDEVVELAGYMP